MSGERQGEPGQAADERGDQRGADAPPNARRGDVASGAPRRDRVAEAGGGADDQALDAAPDGDVDADQRRQARLREPLRDAADEAAAERRGGDECDAALDRKSVV